MHSTVTKLKHDRLYSVNQSKNI